MLHLFIDETSDKKFKDYLGLCLARVNSAHYSNIKGQVSSILGKYGWSPSKEFKGSYLFSASSGCKEVSVDQRIQIASELLGLSTSAMNRRMAFYYLKASGKDKKDAYLRSLPLSLEKALPKAENLRDKNLVSIHCDHRDDISSTSIKEAVMPILAKRGWILFEDIICSRSNFDTIGILYADIVGYLIGRIDTISNDRELFNIIEEKGIESSGRLKKLGSSQELIKLIKRFDTLELRVKA